MVKMKDSCLEIIGKNQIEKDLTSDFFGGMEAFQHMHKEIRGDNTDIEQVIRLVGVIFGEWKYSPQLLIGNIRETVNFRIPEP